MKRKGKPCSPAEIAKRLGITQEQLEAQAREQAKECFRKEGLLGPELTPREKEELEKQARAATNTFEKDFPRDPNWPPFPLPDIYDDDDPHLVRAAYAAMRRLRRAYVPEIGFNGQQLKIALEVALAIRSAWSNEGLGLREVPLAKNLNWPVERDFIELEQWFLDAETAIDKEIAIGSQAPAGNTQDGAAASGKAEQNVEFHGPVKNVIVQQTDKGRNTVIENSHKTDAPQSAWLNGSFYLFVFLLIVVLLAVLVKWVPWYILPGVMIVSVVIMLLIGVLGLRRDNLLSEKGFLEVVRMVFASLPLIGRLFRYKPL